MNMKLACRRRHRAIINNGGLEVKLIRIFPEVSCNLITNDGLHINDLHLETIGDIAPLPNVIAVTSHIGSLRMKGGKGDCTMVVVCEESREWRC